MSKLASLLLAAAVLPACSSSKPEVDPSALDAIDVNEEGKEDSLRRPTLRGALELGGAATGRVTASRAFHAFNFTYQGEAGRVRFDARGLGAWDDLAVVAYRRNGTRWALAGWNDDCGGDTLDACYELAATAGRYRVVVTTYDALAGAPVAADYELAATCVGGDCAAAACGGLAGLACGAGEYCNFPLEATCGAADQTGTCAPIPEVCTQQYQPVCGCDDRTYGNACLAAAAGVSVSSEGECPARACGARAGDTCGPTEFCAFELSAVCGRADAQGTCQPRPEACIALYDPVCGCDNQTYGNACSAASAGVGVLHDGECTEQP